MAVLGLAACGDGADVGFGTWRGGSETPTAPTGLYDFADAPPAGAIDVVAEPGGPPCTSPMEDCRADYVDFLDLAAEWERPRDEAELRSWIAEALAAPPPAGEITPDRFAAAVTDALGVRFLFDQVESVRSAVIFLSPEPHLGHLVHRFLIEDPWVGRFGGSFVLPPGVGPHPAVLAEHGHGTDASDWLNTYGGLDYVDAGFVLFAVDHRMMYADDGESEVGHSLLRAGFTLAGLHIYESLLVHRLMRWHSEVDPERIGLLGHSAGSNRGNLMVRLTDTFGAYVSDNPTLITFDPADPRYFEALVPDLAPWQEALADSGTAASPTLEVEYGFPDGTAGLVEFFTDRLGH